MTGVHKLTLADYHTFIEQPENADGIFELIDGEIVEKTYYFVPSVVAGRIIQSLAGFVSQYPIGYVTGADGGYRMPDGQLYVPDVGFIRKERMPAIPDREVLVPPDLAVEVMSPTDKRRVLRRKAEAYLAAGTPLVWLVFPDEQVLEVYRRDEDVIVLTVADALDGDDVLPGLVIPVAALFTA